MTTDLVSTTIPAVFCQITCVKPCPSIIYWSTTSLTFVVAYGYFSGQSLVLSLLFFHLTPLQEKRITIIIYVNKVNKKIAKRIIIYHLLLSLLRPQVSGFNFTLQRNQIRRWDKPKVFICCIIFISRNYPQGVLTLIGMYL